MVKAQVDVPPKEGDPDSYKSMEIKMKRKKRKGMSDDKVVDDESLVPSVVDPTVLVQVPKDSRINADNILDGNVQKQVPEWLEKDLKLGIVSNGVANGTTEALSSSTIQATNDVVERAGGFNGSGMSIEDGSRMDSSINTKNSRKNKSKGVVDGVFLSSMKVSVGNSEKAVVFQAGGSTGGVAATGDIEAVAASEKSTAGLSFGEFNGLEAAALPRPHVVQNGASKIDGNAGSNIPSSKALGNFGKTRSTTSRFAPINNINASTNKLNFAGIFKDNRTEGNGFKLSKHDFNDDEDAILDESDEVPFVETWGYCLIGCFMGSFPGRPALDEIAAKWGVKCRVLPYGKGWTVFRFMSEEDRLHVLHGGRI